MQEYYVGLISGTSVDGIDSVVLNTADGKFEIVAAECYPLPPNLTQSIHALCNTESLEPCQLDNSGSLLAKTHRDLGFAFASAVTNLLDKAALQSSDICAIGSHGQTVWHQPPSRNSQGQVVKNGFSLQIACPEIIARQTGIRVVNNFRKADMQAGGEGAPLAPAFHAAIAPLNKTVGFLNMGGIANITLVQNGEVITGYDTGPANTLMDSWINRHKDKPYDSNGDWAASGTCDISLLNNLLSDPYFELTAPKSTGREYFNLGFLEKHGVNDDSSRAPADAQATLLALSAHSIANEINKLPVTPETVYCCGGGVHNRVMMTTLAELLPAIKITTTDALGIAPDYIEASLFAWLAKKNLAAEAVNLCAVTGAKGMSVLGAQSG